MSRYNYSRRPPRPVPVGSITIGGSAPVQVQSMTNLPTTDVEGCVAQALRIARAGGQLVRLTTQGVKEAESIGLVRDGLRRKGCDIPVVADVHFNPRAAFKAATTCDKVRINPGNFVDAARTFKRLEYTPEQYAAELDKIRASLLPFLALCAQNGTAVRLGVNHGSLSDRIMSRYGDTPRGMVESVMEYLRIAAEAHFHNIVISIKASNTVVMTDTVRMLVKAMDAEGMDYPLHLGVTEAGDGEDGRIKSAVGIGALLAEGLGDTVRVSLSEDPEAEIPVARALVDYITSRAGHTPIPAPSLPPAPYPIRGDLKVMAISADMQGHIPLEWHETSTASDPDNAPRTGTIVLSPDNVNIPGALMSWMERYVQSSGKAAVVAKITYPDTDKETVQLRSAADFGALLLSGYAAGIWLDAPGLSAQDRAETELAILQAARLRFTKTEYIACPGCGRTLFDLQGTLARVKEATSSLPGLKIAVMGCIVNGPGEMADADFGYVGAAAGKVSLYRGKECIEKNIPQEEAPARLLALIKESMPHTTPT